MARQFKAYNPNQKFLLPPDLRDWLPLGHLALFINDLVDKQLDLAKVFASYEHATDRGQPPYHPSMMMKLLLYGYAVGIRSSNGVESVAWRMEQIMETDDAKDKYSQRQGSVEPVFGRTKAAEQVGVHPE